MQFRRVPENKHTVHYRYRQSGGELHLTLGAPARRCRKAYLVVSCKRQAPGAESYSRR